MQKQEWIRHIETILKNGQTFVVSITDENKAPILFACDMFRRKKYEVQFDFSPSQTLELVLHITIHPKQSALEFTIRREQTPEEIIAMMLPENIHHVSVRGCGTVVNTVCKIVQWAIHNGWFVEQKFLNTLTQINTNSTKQRNTTLLVVLRRGSSIGSI